MTESLAFQRVVEVSQEVLARIWAKGSYDIEPSLIRGIVESCREGNLSVGDAIERIVGVEASQQDYH